MSAQSGNELPQNEVSFPAAGGEPTPVQPVVSRRSRAWLVLPAVGAIVLVAVVWVACTNSTHQSLKPSSGASQLTPTADLKHALAGVPFPSQAVAYPSGWPAVLQFPSTFTLVEQETAPIPSSATTYTAKLRFKGTTQQAEVAMAAFLRSQAWNVDSKNANYGVYLVTFDRGDGQQSGAIDVDVDPQDSKQALLLALISF